MKKRVVILSILLLFSMGSVHAASDAKVTKSYSVNSRGLYIDGNKAIHINKYTVNTRVNNGRVNEVAYCADPQFSRKGSYSFSSSDEFSSSKKEDIGLLEILKLGYSNYNQTYSFCVKNGTPESVKTNPGKDYCATISGDDLYVATSIAVRAYELGLFQKTIKKITYSNGADLASAHINRGLQWARYYASGAISALGVSCNKSNPADCLAASVNSKFNWYDKKVYIYSDNVLNSASYNVLYGASQLFIAGLTKAASGSSSGNMEFKEVSREKISPTEEYVHLTITANSLAKGTVIGFQSLNCENCQNNYSLNNLEIYNKLNNRWDTLGIYSYNDGENLLNNSYFNFNGNTYNGTAKLRFKVTKKLQDGPVCDDGTYKLNYIYKTNEKNYTGGRVKSNQSDSQDFYFITSLTGNNNGTSYTIEGDLTCATEEEVVCETKIKNPTCTESSTDATAEISEPSNIKKCIVDRKRYNGKVKKAKDIAGNTYNLASKNGGVDSNNPYCQVFCKEDYSEIRFQEKVPNVVCGRYFSISSNVKGTKSCYTSGKTMSTASNGEASIDKEQFTTDLVKYQEQMIEYYNEYLEYKTALTTIESDSSKYTGYYVDECDEEGCSCDSYDCSGYYSSSSSLDDDIYGYNITCNSSTGECRYTQNKRISYYHDSDGGRDGHGCPGSCSSGSYSRLQRYLENLKNHAQKNMEKAYTNYKNAIKSYNSCTTGWKTNLKFDQEIEFDYNELWKDNEAHYTYYNLLDASDKDEKSVKYLQGKTTDTLDNTISICTGTATDEYECTGNTYTFAGSIDGKPDNYGYNAQYGSIFKNKIYTICNTSGCIQDTRNISEASFVKKTQTKEREYETPTAFYQLEANGKITVKSGYTGNKLQLEALQNKLPVSTKNVGAGVFKMMLTGLGEYYDTGNVGRLIDYGTGNDKTVAKALEKKGSFDGNYKCNYESLCTPDDCPDCKASCYGQNYKDYTSNLDEDKTYGGDESNCQNNKVLYSTGYVTDSSSLNTTTSSVLKFDLPSDATNVSITNTSYFGNNLVDYRQYLNMRYKNDEDADGNTKSVDIPDEQTFKKSSLNSSNFEFTVSEPVKKNNKWQVTITTTYYNHDNVTPFFAKESSVNQNVYFTPKKFEISYESQSECNNDTPNDWRDYVCEIPDSPECEGDGCTPDCINCIINESKLNLNVKNISLTNVKSVKRNFGYNWLTKTELSKYSSKIQNQLNVISNKANITINEIEKNNEMVYDSSKNTASSNLAFSIKLTPTVLNEIKSYNRKEENKGGYGNDSLTCYDATISGTTYKNIYCYSELIDDLVKNHKDLIVGADKRNSSNNKNDANKLGYWTLYPNYTRNKNGLGGPSWK